MAESPPPPTDDADHDLPPPSASVSPENDTLAAALVRHGLELPADQARQVEAFCKALWELNQQLNLTRHTDYEKFVTRDLVDSLRLAALLHEDEMALDMGSGGGVPGVLLAILRPDVRVCLAESVGKKAAALNEIVASLELPVPVYEARAEDLLGDLRFDVLTARAVGPLVKILRWLAPHWGSVGRLLLVKGPKWVAERGEARHYGLLRNLELRKAAAYAAPGTDVESVILKLWPKGQPEP